MENILRRGTVASVVTEFDPIPGHDAVGGVRERWHTRRDTFGRVYDVVLGITEPTSCGEIASIADCSLNAAEKHLERLAGTGIVRADRERRSTRYYRNEGYLEWREARRIAEELTVEEIRARVRRLEERHDELEERFGTTDPASVTVFEEDDHEAIHERMAAVGEWQSTRRDARCYELARRLAGTDGHERPVEMDEDASSVGEPWSNDPEEHDGRGSND